MEFKLFGYKVTIQKDNLATQVDKLAQEGAFYRPGENVYIPRIKAHRQLTGSGLLEAKTWVEKHFAENGRGKPL